MKKFELGEKVFIEKYYRRNMRNSFSEDGSNRRYTLLEINKEGVYAGRRTINTIGYSDYLGYEEGFIFIPQVKEQVHLVAINHKQIIYVPDKYIRRA